MHPYVYNSSQLLPVNINEAWDFFSAPGNLARITPPQLKFKVLSGSTGNEIYEGMIIDYNVSPLLGIPLHWQTEITRVQKPHLFIDVQVKGPYHTWQHQHRFHSVDAGTLMEDKVKYVLPFGIAGRWAHRLIVRKKVEDIFAYRRKIIGEMFGK